MPRSIARRGLAPTPAAHAVVPKLPARDSRNAKGEGTIWWEGDRCRGEIPVPGGRPMRISRRRGARRAEAVEAEVRAALDVLRMEYGLGGGASRGSRASELPAVRLDNSLGVWIERYLAKADPRLRPPNAPKRKSDLIGSSWIDYRRAVDLHLLGKPALRKRRGQVASMERHPLLGRSVDTISFVDIEELYRDLESSGVGASPIRKLRNVLSSTYQMAMLDRSSGVTANPTVGHDLGAEPSRFAIVGLSRDLVLEMLSWVADHRFGDLYELLFYSSNRLGEVVAWRWDRVNLNAREVEVVEQFGKVLATNGPHLTTGGFKGPKTVAGTRTIKLNDAALEIMKRRYRAAGRPRTGLVFPSVTDSTRPIDKTWLLEQFQAVLVAHGMPPWRLHDLRHASLTFLVEDGKVPQAQRQGGHATAGITLSLYTHATLEGQQEAVRGLDLRARKEETIRSKRGAPAQRSKASRGVPEPA